MSKFAAAVLLSAFAFSSHAAVINFNNLASTSMAGNSSRTSDYTAFYNRAATVGGYTFSAPAYEYFMSSNYGGDRSDYAYNGSDFLMSESTVTLRSQNAALFSVSSLDLASWDSYDYNFFGHYSGVYATSAKLVGVRADGSEISTIINLDARSNASKTGGNDFTNYVLSGFTGLKSLTINATNFNYLAIDNIAVNAASVPEPGTLAILGLGLGALAFARRRKQ